MLDQVISDGDVSESEAGVQMPTTLLAPRHSRSCSTRPRADMSEWAGKRISRVECEPPRDDAEHLVQCQEGSLAVQGARIDESEVTWAGLLDSSAMSPSSATLALTASYVGRYV